MSQALTLNEIRQRALSFSREWKGEKSESAEKQTFWNEFFDVFGIHRRRVASFEVPVALRDGHHGKIDLFWRGILLVEHKSEGADLTAAFEQATNYFDGIAEEDLPAYVIVSDFARFRVYHLDDERTQVEFPLAKLHEHVASFGFLSGHTFTPQEDAPQVNVDAARLMAKLHDALRKNGYSGHPLAVLLVRLMFCMFADRTALWPRAIFRDLIQRKTRDDGSDTGSVLGNVFAVLDTPIAQRQRNLDEDLASLPYVNGHLFRERFDPPAFDSVARKILLMCCAFDWSAVSPAIFGAMFQGVMEEEQGRRREIGAHYTSEKNILKALGPLFLDELRADVASARTERELAQLLDRLAKIKILDPACGCGNFLIVAFREIRLLEIEVHRKLQKVRKAGPGRFLRIDFMNGIKVDALYGIEIEEFPVRIAETALYLIDHMMNMKASEEFGENLVRLPLTTAPNIVNGNALEIDWETVVLAERLTCVVGNPPFVGKKARSRQQVEDMKRVFGDWPSAGELDYVAAWYVRALNYIRGRSIPVAFVSTNSITQGEQVLILWPRLIGDGVKIHFAHRTFRWDNDAPGEASVYCVIVGWSLVEPRKRVLFDYETPKSDPHSSVVARINPYLVDAEDVFITTRNTALSATAAAVFGNMPNDDGNFLFDDGEYSAFIREEPNAASLFRPFVSAREFLHNQRRWCLWLKDVPPSQLRELPRVMERIERVRVFRESSSRSQTRKLASTPSLFGEIRQPSSAYFVIPRHTSERRQFVPIAGVTEKDIVADSCIAVVSDDPFVFGVVQSTMHMAWMRHICGRLEARYRYSVVLVYNCFPWPNDASDTEKERVRTSAGKLMQERKAIAGQSLADLYDVDVMPRALLDAHKELDRDVDRCYRSQPFSNEVGRMRFLFERYAAQLGHLPLAPAARKGRRSRR